MQLSEVFVHIVVKFAFNITKGVFFMMRKVMKSFFDSTINHSCLQFSRSGLFFCPQVFFVVYCLSMVNSKYKFSTESYATKRTTIV